MAQNVAPKFNELIALIKETHSGLKAKRRDDAKKLEIVGFHIDIAERAYNAGDYQRAGTNLQIAIDFIKSIKGAVA